MSTLLFAFILLFEVSKSHDMSAVPAREYHMTFLSPHEEVITWDEKMMTFLAELALHVTWKP